MRTSMSSVLFMFLCCLWGATLTASATKQLTKDHAGNPWLVEIDGSIYSLLGRPPDSSPLVQEAQERITATMDVHTLSKQLTSTCEFFILVHRTQTAELRAWVRSLSFQVNQLGQKTFSALSDLGSKSEDTLRALSFVYEELYKEGQEPIGKTVINAFIVTLQATNYIIKKASQLQEVFTKMRSEVEDVLKNAEDEDRDYLTKIMMDGGHAEVNMREQNANDIIRSSVGGLTYLNAFVRVGEMFWISMKTLCNQVKERSSIIRDTLDIHERYNGEFDYWGRDSPKMVWRSNWLRMTAVQLSADWVAVQSISREARKGMEEALSNLLNAIVVEDFGDGEPGSKTKSEVHERKHEL